VARLPTPEADSAERWVAEQLGDLALEGAGGVRRSRLFRGGQTAADLALSGYSVRGYAARRNQVLPDSARGASRLSPYIRHGLLTLPRVWRHAETGPARDRTKFHDELLWQEYARHLYARVGREIARPLRRAPAVGEGWTGEPWPEQMACMAEINRALAEDGWLVNQSRMWAASQWTVRAGAKWQDGERRMYRHLVDGSAAANGLGWQWSVGAATGKPYGFSRWQVEKRAPELCEQCVLRQRCPVQRWPEAVVGERLDPPERLGRDPDPERTAGPEQPRVTGSPEAVWLTAESLGDDDPALAAHPDVPAVFVFDEPLLARLRLSGLRLVFLAECLADLAQRRPVEVHRGDPTAVLAGRSLAATHTPVPGFAVRSAQLDVVALHPWPWLRRPAGGSVASFTAWARSHEKRRAA
jgi:deoxyribodipyrimidine photo-lyase